MNEVELDQLELAMQKIALELEMLKRGNTRRN